ncbi:MAG TPA: galactokinase family protein [Bryobacteraceae bacterium]|nr:galactokinase family protein [Bryobacteraceae bacterium]
MNDFEAQCHQLRAAGFFSPGQPVFLGRSPGRLDLMGGNVDYTGGLVFQATIREATWAAIQPRADRRVVFWNPQVAARGWRDCSVFELNELADEVAVRRIVNRDPAIRWTAYVLGVFYWLRLHYPEAVSYGANVYLYSEIPLNKGVSSSAAVEVAVMKPAARAYGIDLHGIELAEACQWVENVIAESACGIMDQAAVVLGDEGYVLPLLCQPCQPRPLVKLPSDLCCWAVDSGVSHAVTGIEYEAARAAAFIGYKLICDWESLLVTRDPHSRIPRFTDARWRGYLSEITPSLFRSRYEQRLPKTMMSAEFLIAGQFHADPFTPVRPDIRYRVRNCTRYACEENQRIQLFAELARGSAAGGEDAWRLMGDLMYQSHYSYTECGLGNEATDLLVDLVRAQGADRGLYGAKVTGGGAGGTVAVLGHRDAYPAFAEVVKCFGDIRQIEPYVFQGSSMGADRFGVAVEEQ